MKSLQLQKDFDPIGQATTAQLKLATIQNSSSTV